MDIVVIRKDGSAVVSTKCDEQGIYVTRTIPKEEYEDLGWSDMTAEEGIMEIRCPACELLDEYHMIRISPLPLTEEEVEIAHNILEISYRDDK